MLTQNQHFVWCKRKKEKKYLGKVQTGLEAIRVLSRCRQMLENWSVYWCTKNLQKYEVFVMLPWLFRMNPGRMTWFRMISWKKAGAARTSLGLWSSDFTLGNLNSSCQRRETRQWNSESEKSDSEMYFQDSFQYKGTSKTKQKRRK